MPLTQSMLPLGMNFGACSSMPRVPCDFEHQKRYADGAFVQFAKCLVVGH